MPDLLDLLEEWTDAVEWVPLYKPHGVTVLSVVVGDRCRDCGASAGYNQGGSIPGVGSLCDDCALIDECHLIEHDPVIERDEYMGTQRAVHCSCGWWRGPICWGSRADGTPDHEYTRDELCALVDDHLRPRHASHWGDIHEAGDCERLHKDQERRRARYRAKHREG